MFTDGPTTPDAVLPRFGLQEFRAGQREVIETVLAGRDTLCVMPTGGGKSLCYQLPALLLPKPTLVVSPLIALMKDQEDSLLARNIPATALHSNLGEAELSERLAGIARGEYPLVYVAPERFRSRRFLEVLRRVGLSLLAIDEAHCISEWGHDFRPDYARLGQAREELGFPTTIALTATATDMVRRDVVEQLRLSDPAVYIRGFDRPNLTYAVADASTKARKLERLTEILEGTPGSVIVYCASRKSCEEVGELLRHTVRRSATIYHAGLQPDDRRQSQDRFMDGKVDVVVATNAFGMGVDKPDIRAVVHYNLPGSLEAYYQEAGRAGRDGLPARCELLFSYSDRYIQEFFIDGEYPDKRLIFAVLNFLRELDTPLIELTRQELKERMGLDASEMAMGSCLKILEQAGLLERLRPRQNMAIVRIHETDRNLASRLPKGAGNQRKVLELLEGIVGDQRGEDVYFYPDGLAKSVEIERATLTRTLHDLEKKFKLEYIPPFRGSATRLVDRTTPPEKAPIDFPHLAERKNAELQKLERVFDYCRLTACRRQAILGYFGEKSGRCGNCDNCLGPAGMAMRPVGKIANGTAATSMPPAPAAWNDVAKNVFRTVIEAVQETHGRFGKILVAQTLAGSQSKEVARFGLQRRTCFGRLASYRQSEAIELVEAMLSAGFLMQQGDPLRPTLAVAETGRAALKGSEDTWPRVTLAPALRAKVMAVAPVGAETPVPRPTPPPRETSREPAPAPTPRSVPLPSPKSTAPTAPRVSNESARSESATAPPSTPKSAPPASGAKRPHFHWTVELLERGFGPHDIAEIRRLDVSVVVEHALAAARAGRTITWPPFATGEYPVTCEANLELLRELVGTG